LVVFSDRKVAVETAPLSGITDHYIASITSARDYGVFGEYLTNRVFTPDAFPNSFNGKRDDDELNGWQNYGMRNYLKYTRRLMDRVDDLSKKYPELSPYQFASNKPIKCVDLDGGEAAEEDAEELIRGYGNSSSSSNNGLKPAEEITEEQLEFLRNPNNIKEFQRQRQSAPRERYETLPDGRVVKVPNMGTALRTTNSEEIEENKSTPVSNNSRPVYRNQGPYTLSYRRGLAVKQAWQEEKELVKTRGYGTRDWTDPEKEELLNSKDGKVSGYEGHHLNTVKDNPEMAGEPDNIEFVTRPDHLDRHEGNFRNQKSDVPLINRQQMIQDAQK
jgi:RHS repeat-associated protein